MVSVVQDAKGTYLKASQSPFSLVVGSCQFVSDCVCCVSVNGHRFAITYTYEVMFSVCTHGILITFATP